ncbi:MAG: ATP-binding protein [Pseudomonadota bacterium]
MKNTGGHMELKEFDQDFGISDLLPFTELDDLWGGLKEVSPDLFSILLPDGTVYYRKGILSGDQEDVFSKALEQQEIGSSKAVTLSEDRISLLPIECEFETIGHLCIGFEKDKRDPMSLTVALGVVLLKFLNRIIHHRKKVLMTARLHCRVVEDSYAELMEKAALLERSERKYRLLAESLEREVEKKTREIEESHMRLMQQHKMASIGQLAAGVAHEINNPVGFVKSNLSTLGEYRDDFLRLLGQYEILEAEIGKHAGMDDGISKILAAIQRMKGDIDLPFITEDYRKVIEESLDGAERVVRIVSDLTYFAHLDKAEPEYADLNQGIERTLNLVWNDLKRKADVVKDLGPIPPVECYPQHMNQAIMNILVNAAQAIDGRGRIDIMTRSKDGYVEIRISDTGCGMPERILPRIFDPFFTTKDVGRGTGLGLHVTYDIIRKHHGSIQVQSEEAKGTTFTIRLPVNRGKGCDLDLTEGLVGNRPSADDKGTP